jgi:regulator of PEP synthase PpsR (kinase-PPPase family)
LKKKVLAFTVTPRWLFEVRTMQGVAGVSLRAVAREVAAAEKEFLRRGYPVLNITGMTVEAIAATVLKTLGTGRRHLVYE